MLITLIQKEMMHHILSVRFVALLLMCLLLVPLTLHINYGNYRQNLVALLFTFDVVAGEREAGTLRITLANALPRDLFLWSKLIGGYFVFVVPFLVSFSVY